ncbi:MAG: aryl-sulfate sulfotransferase [Bacteroidia bacterium]|nr:aryl-sulfate sulfotransferase [Bacteroidia bacterium]
MRTTSFTRITFLLLLYCAASLHGQTNTVGMLLHDTAKAFRGYTLFAPVRSNTTYLIDNDGKLLRSWKSAYFPGQAAMLLPDGSLLRAAAAESGHPFTAGGAAGRVERFDWSGTLTWSFDYFSDSYCTHHDVEVLPNGNILLIAWMKKSLSEAAAAGRNLSGATYTEVWSEKVIEVQPTGSNGGVIVWEWDIWDHLVQDYDSTKANYGIVSQHPELFDINFGDMKDDWLHINSVRYNALRDEIILSVHATHEVWVIDHSTTKAEAAGHTGGKRGKGGDLLYRWGNPQAYKMGNATDQKLFAQHDARWIDAGYPGAGNILIFNNGPRRPGGAYSSIEEIVPPLAPDGSYERATDSAFGPDRTAWTYKASPPASFFALNVSGATRLENGNTLICDGPDGVFFEVTAAGEIVWRYINPVSITGPMTQGDRPMRNTVFKINRYAPDYAGVAGRDLTPGGTIELYPTGVKGEAGYPSEVTLYQNYPNPFNPVTTMRFSIPQREHVVLTVSDVMGRVVQTLIDGVLEAGSYELPFNADGIMSGILLSRLRSGSATISKSMMLLK